MLDAGKTRSEIMEFLGAEIRKRMVKSHMADRAAAGKPISEEKARKWVDRLLADDGDGPVSE
jgi:hypothetical protein